MLDNLVWTPPVNSTDLDQTMVEVVMEMAKTPSLEEFITHYGMAPLAFRDHVEGKVKEANDRWKKEADPDSVAESMYILGVLTGISVEKRRTSGEGNQS